MNDDQKLGDRIVAALSDEVRRLRTQWAAKGVAEEQYSVAWQVNRIAELLGVEPLQINGALSTLHREKKVIGYRVINTGGEYKTYVIALRED